MKKKKIFIIIINFLFILLLFACNKTYTISGIEKLEVGEEYLFTLSDDISGSWRSSDNKIATVYNGVVKGIDVGSCEIQFVTNTIVARYTVTITSPKLDISIKGPSTMIVGDSCKYTYTTSKEISKNAVFSLSNDNATVSENGVVTALKQGNTTLCVEVYNNKSFFEIEITEKPKYIIIEGPDQIPLFEEAIYTKTLINFPVNSDVTFSTSDSTIATIDENGKLETYKTGVVTIYCNCLDVTIEKKLTITNPLPKKLIVTYQNTMSVGESQDVIVDFLPTGYLFDYSYVLSDESLASFENNKLVALKEGILKLTFTCLKDTSIYQTINIEILPKKEINKIVGDDIITVGIHQNYNLFNEVSTEVCWKSSDETKAIIKNGTVLGLTPGLCTIYASYGEYSFSKIIEIEKNDNSLYDESTYEKALDILNNMTIEEKIGQMFIIGFNGTSVSSDFEQLIKKYHFGNVIYMGANCTEPSTLAKMSQDIQSIMFNYNNIPAFISTDQEGGRVCRLKTDATHFISQMAIAATGDYNNTYLVGKAIGNELSYYGINFDLAPVLDVNNNPENPVIGNRSYSDDPFEASIYGLGMINGLRDENIMSCAKHFPGHGNTSTDSHYGLPKITTSKDDLYKTELAPFIASISNGIDAIMTTHIIFEAIDNDLPATLSSKVLHDLLRDELNFQGLIVTDGMAMKAITDFFGTPDVASVLAVLAGDDLITYTDSKMPVTAYEGVMKAYNDGKITLERINESVLRIILAKIKYGLFDEDDSNKEIYLQEHEQLNNNLAKEALTLGLGNMQTLSKDKKIVIISPTCSYEIDKNLSSQSLGCYMKYYLEKNGYSNVSYLDVSSNIKSSEKTKAMQLIAEADEVVLAFSNVYKSNYKNTISFINEILNKDKKIIYIALDSPYDYKGLSSSKLQTYLCLYSYQKATSLAIASLISGEYELNMHSSINFK